MEECDDGNRKSGDGCDAACRSETAPLWSVTYDGRGIGTQRFTGLARHEGQLFTVGAGESELYGSIPLVTAWSADGDEQWTWIGEDQADSPVLLDIATLPGGTVVAVGKIGRQEPRRWVITFDPSGGVTGRAFVRG